MLPTKKGGEPSCPCQEGREEHDLEYQLVPFLPTLTGVAASRWDNATGPFGRVLGATHMGQRGQDSRRSHA